MKHKKANDRGTDGHGIISEYEWCLHCERTYKRGQFRLENGMQMCPYEGCDGAPVIDGWDWNLFRSAHPDYPPKPERGFRYPMRTLPFDFEEVDDEEGEGPEVFPLTREHLLAAEVFGYSFENYADHVEVDNVRFTKLMPKDIRTLEKADSEGWDLPRLAKKLETSETKAEMMLDKFRQARKIVEAPSPAKAFLAGVRQSLEWSLKKESREDAWFSELMTQIGYRAADFGYLLALEGKTVCDYSEELREENESQDADK